MKIHQVGVEFLCVNGQMDGQTDRMKLIAAFHNCVNMPKKLYLHIISIHPFIWCSIMFIGTPLLSNPKISLLFFIMVLVFAFVVSATAW
jgi:hypothetical protein